MIEANEDIALVTERQMRDVEQAQAQAKAIAEGREVHPALLEAASSASGPTPVDLSLPSAQTAAQTVQQPPRPPTDPDAAIRHFRLSIAAVVVLVLLFFWLRQKKS